MDMPGEGKWQMIVNRSAAMDAANCRRSLRRVLLALAMGFAALPAWGWGGTGHRMICEIAWQHLTPVARSEVQTLLRLERGSHRFSESCTWADRVRGDARYDFLAPWHYLNLPPGTTRYTDRLCPRQGCVVRAIETLRAELGDAPRPPQERLQALKLLGHFVGDVHQPLHVGYAEDRGGTQRLVRYADRREPVSLHVVWDDLLMAGWASDWQSRSRELARGIGVRERRLWSQGDAADWAMESFRLTETWVYPQVADDVIDEVEIKSNRPVVETQLRKAGWRLAWVLNAALDPGASGPAP